MGNNDDNDGSSSIVRKDFFISYAQEDRARARWICEQLEAAGYSVIFPRRDFAVGNNFVLEMERAVTTSAQTIAVLSPAYLASQYTQPEWAVAFRHDPKGEKGLLLPVLIHPCEVEGLLGSIVRINLIGKDEAEAQKHLLRGVRQALPTSPSTVTSSDQTASPSSPRIWSLPHPRNPLFTGREDLLEQLHRQLTRGGARDVAVTALTQPQALKGLGGIGKTQLAIEYAYRYQVHYPHTFWINAATEESLLASYVALADLLPSFPAKDEQDQYKLMEAVKGWLEQSQTRWLLLFDNADDFSLLRPFLPTQGPGHILLTTRAHAVGSMAASIEVKKMSLMEGTCLLLRRIYGLAPHLSAMQVLEHVSDEDTNEAGNIVAALDYLPLALDQAGAYIEETGCDYAEYLSVYERHRKAVLAKRGAQATDYPDSVATTWSVSFQKVEQANLAAAELLRLCAFLSPDSIPEELIREEARYWSRPLQTAAADPFAFHQMMEELLKFSLIERLARTRLLSIHRLVQAVQKDRMESDEQRQWAERVICAVNAAFPDDPENVTVWPSCRRYLDQTQMCYALLEEYKLPLIEGACLLNRTGIYLAEHALYTIAEPLHQRALKIFEMQSGSEHPDTADSLHNLANIYQEQGKYAEADSLYQSALQILEKQLGPDHPETAQILNNLAALYWTQGKYAQAEPLYTRALAIQEQQLGPDHPRTANNLNNLALLYQDQGKYAQAEPLYQRALRISEQQLGSEHPSTASSLNSLGALYCAQGEYAKAEPLYKRALAIREQQLGPDHPETAQILNNLASLYRDQDKYDEAEHLYRRALQISEQQLGPDHPNTAAGLSNLAAFYWAQGEYTEAEKLHKRALAIREQQLGPDHPSTATSLNNLAILYQEQGKYTEAERLYKRSLRVSEQQLGPEHPATAISLNNLGTFYWEQGKHVKAKRLFKKALAIQEQKLGPDHPNVANSLSNLAIAHQEQGKYTEAELLYKRALTIREQRLGPEHPDTVESLNDLTELYQLQDKYVDAELLLLHAIQVSEQQLGLDHLTTATNYSNLAELYQLQDKYTEAEPLLQQVLRIDTKIYGEDDSNVAADQNSLAGLYKGQGKYEQAEKMYLQSLKTCELRLGSEHPDTITVLDNLAGLYAIQERYEEAEPLYQRAFTICEQSLGWEHPSAQEVHQNYATFLRKVGRDAEARALETEPG